MPASASRPTPPSAPHRLLGRTGLLLLALALCAGSAAPPAPALVAAAAQGSSTTNMRFHLNVHRPAMFCAGQRYSILVTPVVDLAGRRPDGSRFQQPDRVVTGVPVKAEILDPSIATITPATQRSGALSVHEHLTPESQPGFGELTFSLRAQKAGTTHLILTAEVPARYSGGTPQYFGPQGFPTDLVIDVIECEYLVTAVYTWELAGVGFRYWNVGTLRAKITATDPETYGGDGDFHFFLNHYDLTCNERLAYQFANHVTAIRTRTPEELKLTFSFGEGGTTQSCFNTYLVSNAPFTDPGGPWSGTPITFQVTGGSKRIQLVARSPGGFPPTGWVTITVTPLAARGGR